MAPLPTPVRAALGLAANAVDAARTLPDRVVELPVLAVSTALQISLRAQQRYTELALRGDELIGRLHAPPEEPPSWATFDDEVPPAPTRPAEPSDDIAPVAESAEPVTEAPADIPISTPADEPPAPVKSAAKQPRARKKTAAAAKTTARTAAKSSAAKPVRAPRQAKPSAFDRTEE
jgi:hypothetical protein